MRVLEKKDQNMFLKVERFMKGSGLEIREMDLGYKFGLMVQNMKENGD